MTTQNQSSTDPLQSQHTPGPWKSVKVDREPNKTPYMAIRTPRMEAFDIARIGAESHCTPIDEANARVIAASPELLAALKKVVALVERSAPLYAETATMRTAKAAITSATEAVL